MPHSWGILVSIGSIDATQRSIKHKLITLVKMQNIREWAPPEDRDLQFRNAPSIFLMRYTLRRDADNLVRKTIPARRASTSKPSVFADQSRRCIKNMTTTRTFLGQLGLS